MSLREIRPQTSVINKKEDPDGKCRVLFFIIWLIQYWAFWALFIIGVCPEFVRNLVLSNICLCPEFGFVLEIILHAARNPVIESPGKSGGGTLDIPAACVQSYIRYCKVKGIEVYAEIIKRLEFNCSDFSCKSEGERHLDG